ncbi:PIG-X [Bipolaris maydis]|nr:PIG-X [Bipolaris maydis]KAJ6198397.1 PIG-X [Bipolaris maydis]
MKQRITYIVHNSDTFSPEQLHVGTDKRGPVFALKGIEAAKEHRITLGLDELPKPLKFFFSQWHEMHLRWQSSKSYMATPPFTSRVSPGLHAFFTPLDDTADDAFCLALHELVSSELKCSTTSQSATKVPVLSERFAMSASLQFYGHLGEIEGMKEDLQRTLCGGKEKGYCVDMVGEIVTARYVDVDYDTISRAVVVTAAWPHSREGGKGWTDEIRLPSKDTTVEIGVLSLEGNTDPEDIQFGGFLTVLGEDEKPSTCKLHTYLTLPSYLFIDQYQFNDSLFLASKHLKRLRSLSGATDLEAPDWAVTPWGSSALFELDVPKPEKIEYPEVDVGPDENVWEGLPTHREIPEGDWNVSIPLHTRYLPAAPSTHATVPVPWPVVFWACRAESGAQHPSNPFDRVHLGYEGLFGPKTRFMTVQPRVESEKELVEWIDVPVLDTRQAAWVRAGTMGVVFAAFLGLCWVLFGGGSKKASTGKKEGEGKKTQ